MGFAQLHGRSSRTLVAIMAAVVFTAIVTFSSYSVLYNAKVPYLSTSAPLEKAAFNETLGFGEIVYISMPFRTDRQDAMNLLAAYSKVNLKMIPGVIGADMNPKERPDNTPKNMRASVLGCWRAHVNAWRYMLDSKLETMLILEDDIDWDYNIHEIFENFSKQMQHNKLRLDPITERERQAAPYGLDWDVLMFGQCLDTANPKRLDLSFSYDDPYSPSAKQIQKNFKNEMSLFMSKDDIGVKRVVSPTYGPACTMGYAITRVGAMRLLTELSYLGLRGPVDNDMAWRMQDGRLRGYTVTPPLFNAWRVNGAKDTDNQYQKEGSSLNGLGNLGGYSYNLKKSARLQLLQDLHQNNWHRYNVEMPPTLVPAESTEKKNADTE